MKRLAIRLLAIGAVVAFVCTAASQPPGGGPPGKKEGKARGGDRKARARRASSWGVRCRPA